MSMDLADEWGLTKPRSLCLCKHTGDGANSVHANRFGTGHGECLIPGCDCKQFTWVGWTLAFSEALRKERPSR
jgi:hypothetical protein